MVVEHEKAGIDDWDAHWQDFSEAARRNPAQEYRRRLSLQLLERRGTPSRLLDIGSGTGEFLGAAGQRWPGVSMLGLEMSETGVAQGKASVPGAEFQVCDAEVVMDLLVV